jgi:hypothetical protein
MVIVVIMVIMVIRCQLRRTSQPAGEAADTKTFVTAPEGQQDPALEPPVCSLFSVLHCTLRRRSRVLFSSPKGYSLLVLHVQPHTMSQNYAKGDDCKGVMSRVWSSDWQGFEIFTLLRCHALTDVSVQPICNYQS